MIEPTVPLVLFYGTIFCFLVLCFAYSDIDLIIKNRGIYESY